MVFVLFNMIVGMWISMIEALAEDLRDMVAEHKGLPVHGYLPQTAEAVAVVNSNKVLEELCLRMLDTLADDPAIDKRWLASGRTDIEKGWMAVNRSIFRPGRAVLPED